MLHQVSIQLKVILTFTVMAVIILIGTLVTWLNVRWTDESLQRIAPEAALLKDAYDCSALMFSISNNLDAYMAETDKDQVALIGERRVDLLKKLTETLLRIGQRPQHEADIQIQEAVVKAQRAVERYDAMAGQAMFKHRVRLETVGPISQQVLLNERDELLREVRSLKADVSIRLESLQAIAVQQHKAVLQSASTSTTGLQSSLWWTAIVAVAIGAIFSALIARSLVRPLKSARTFIQQIGLDLTPRLELNAYDEANDIAYGINDLLAQYDKEIRTLNERVGTITHACQTLDEAAQAFTLVTQRHVQEVSQAEDMFLDLHLNVKDLGEALRKVEGMEKVKGALQEVGPMLETVQQHARAFVTAVDDARKELHRLGAAAQALRDSERQFVERTSSGAHLRDLVDQFHANLKQRIDHGLGIRENAKDAADRVRVLSLNVSLETYRSLPSVEAGEQLVENLVLVSRKIEAASQDLSEYVHAYEDRSDIADRVLRELEKVTAAIEESYRDVDSKTGDVMDRIQSVQAKIQAVSSEGETLTESLRKFTAWFDQQDQAIEGLKNELKTSAHLAKTHAIKLSRTTEVLDGTLLASKSAGDIGVMQQENVHKIRQAVQDFSVVLKKFKVGKSY
jgi:methyl-accepting chemotaxis protein